MAYPPPPPKIKPDRENFLNLGTFPARLWAEEAAWLLGFEPHDIPKLVQKKFLTPIGRPPANCVKMFWLGHVQELAMDPERLGKASDAIRRHSREEKTASGRSMTLAEAL